MLSTLSFLWLNQRLRRFKEGSEIEPKAVDKTVKKKQTKSGKS
jgi:hypothetical protein